jgi:hypothetical protein
MDKLLLGELREFKRVMVEEMKEIKRDVKSLMHFRWKVIGIASLASFLATAIIEFLRH